MDKKITARLAGIDMVFTMEETFELEAAERNEGGILYLDLRLRSETAAVPAFSMEWTHPFHDIQARFTGHYWADRYIIPNWYGGMSMAFNDGSPVYALYSSSGENRMTAAVSDTLPRTNMVADIDEAASAMKFQIRVTPGPASATTDYRATVRLDGRPVSLYRALNELSSWWGEMEENRPLPVPDAARWPYYSTWYAYHLGIDAARLVHEAKRARELGCRGIILDSGWQIPASQPEDAANGQWEIAEDKFPDMASTVREIQELGLKMLVWFSVPHINRANPLYEEMNRKGWILDPSEASHASLDPRFGEVRAFIAERYLRALREWNIDGFKLDFIDSYAKYVTDPAARAGLKDHDGHDISDFDLALDTMLADITRRLTEAKPDVMIEFRQNYTGPRMRAYGNIFRAMDCALGSHTNRFRTADIRMLAGSSAVHSDMITWGPGESPEAAALQLINVLHSVPQISVRIAELSPEHYEMLKFYLGFWNEHRETLQYGEFQPASPENLYPVITCRSSGTQISTLYNRQVVSVDPAVRKLVLVNGTHLPSVTADFESASAWEFTVNDCRGQTVSRFVKTFSGVATVDVPPSGVATAIRRLF